MGKLIFLIEKTILFKFKILIKVILFFFSPFPLPPPIPPEPPALTPHYPAETILPLSLILLKREYKQ
jgi:hypothetical protein